MWKGKANPWPVLHSEEPERLPCSAATAFPCTCLGLTAYLKFSQGPESFPARPSMYFLVESGFCKDPAKFAFTRTLQSQNPHPPCYSTDLVLVSHPSGDIPPPRPISSKNPMRLATQDLLIPLVFARTPFAF